MEGLSLYGPSLSNLDLIARLIGTRSMPEVKSFYKHYLQSVADNKRQLLLDIAQGNPSDSWLHRAVAGHRPRSNPRHRPTQISRSTTLGAVNTSLCDEGNALNDDLDSVCHATRIMSPGCSDQSNKSNAVCCRFHSSSMNAFTLRDEGRDDDECPASSSSEDHVVCCRDRPEGLKDHGHSGADAASIHFVHFCMDALRAHLHTRCLQRELNCVEQMR